MHRAAEQGHTQVACLEARKSEVSTCMRVENAQRAAEWPLVVVQADPPTTKCDEGVATCVRAFLRMPSRSDSDRHRPICWLM